MHFDWSLCEFTPAPHYARTGLRRLLGPRGGDRGLPKGIAPTRALKWRTIPATARHARTLCLAVARTRRRDLRPLMPKWRNLGAVERKLTALSVICVSAQTMGTLSRIFGYLRSSDKQTNVAPAFDELPRLGFQGPARVPSNYLESACQCKARTEHMQEAIQGLACK